MTEADVKVYIEYTTVQFKNRSGQHPRVEMSPACRCFRFGLLPNAPDKEHPVAGTSFFQVPGQTNVHPFYAKYSVRVQLPNNRQTRFQCHQSMLLTDEKYHPDLENIDWNELYDPASHLSSNDISNIEAKIGLAVKNRFLK